VKQTGRQGPSLTFSSCSASPHLLLLLLLHHHHQHLQRSTEQHSTTASWLMEASTAWVIADDGAR
jgi:hypothetical protein